MTGGYSGESVISYKSAETIRKNLDQDKWNVYHGSTFARRDGFMKIKIMYAFPVDKTIFPFWRTVKKITFDAVLVGLHGTPGKTANCRVTSIAWGSRILSCDAATVCADLQQTVYGSGGPLCRHTRGKSLHLFKHTAMTPEQIFFCTTIEAPGLSSRIMAAAAWA